MVFDVSGVPALPPLLDLPPNLVDELVLLDPVLGPLGIEGELAGLFLARACDGDEVGTEAAAGGDLVGNAIFGKAEVTGGFLEGRVNYGVFYYNLFQS